MCFAAKSAQTNLPVWGDVLLKAAADYEAIQQLGLGPIRAMFMDLFGLGQKYLRMGRKWDNCTGEVQWGL